MRRLYRVELDVLELAEAEHALRKRINSVIDPAKKDDACRALTKILEAECPGDDAHKAALT